MRFIIVDVWEKCEKPTRIGNYEVVYFNPLKFLEAKSIRSYPTADIIVSMYREDERSMLGMLDEFKKQIDVFEAQAIVVFQNYFPPEWMVENLGHIKRVVGCFDDPQKTYSSTLPIVWSYHGVFYCSPSYTVNKRFEDVLKMFGVKNSYWLANSRVKSTSELIAAVNASWSSRQARAIYIGKCYGDKVDKLAKINRGIGGKLEIFGKDWPLMGFGGYFGPLRGREFLPKRVRAISDSERRELYLSSLVGLNTHLGNEEETGNMRMFEVPMHGALLLSDKGACNAHAEIFEPEREAIYYDSAEDAIEKCNYYFKNPEKALTVARRGFERAHREYSYEKVIEQLLNWVANL